jgi:hypothetical protein
MRAEDVDLGACKILSHREVGVWPRQRALPPVKPTACPLTTSKTSGQTVPVRQTSPKPRPEPRGKRKNHTEDRPKNR